MDFQNIKPALAPKQVTTTLCTARVQVTLREKPDDLHCGRAMAAPVAPENEQIKRDTPYKGKFGCMGDPDAKPNQPGCCALGAVQGWSYHHDQSLDKLWMSLGNVYKFS